MGAENIAFQLSAAEISRKEITRLAELANLRSRSCVINVSVSKAVMYGAENMVARRSGDLKDGGNSIGRACKPPFKVLPY